MGLDSGGSPTRVDALVQGELYMELGQLAAQYTAAAQVRRGALRAELFRGAQQIRFVRTLYWSGSISPLAALDWLQSGRVILQDLP